ncbi:hypothetical protein LJB95_00180 [Paludibacteraceae bacterium OttesenSCG-928-F17]|nr:hypothetical protein [Paludibacteraceae bacterium OttesenSCG-928-F17]
MIVKAGILSRFFVACHESGQQKDIRILIFSQKDIQNQALNNRAGIFVSKKNVCSKK